MVCTRPVVGAAVATVVAAPGAASADPDRDAPPAGTATPSAPERAAIFWSPGAVRLAAFRAANRAW